MSSATQKHQRSLFDYYQLHVATVLWAQCDKETDPTRWLVFYGIYRVRQDLDIWDMEKKEWGGEAKAKAEVRRLEVVKRLQELEELMKQIPANDALLTFDVGVGRGKKTYALKPLLDSLRSEVGVLAVDLESLGAFAEGQ